MEGSKKVEAPNLLKQYQEFLSNIMFIGSDGRDTAYEIDINGRFIEVPFIRMDDSEVKIIAYDFDGFINYVWNKS